MGKLADAIETKYGFHIRAEFPPKPFTLSTTPQEILKANPDRISWTIINLGTVVVHLAHGEDVSSTNGYYIAANGGSLGMTWDEDGELVGFPIWAVATSVTPTIFVMVVMAQ